MTDSFFDIGLLHYLILSLVLFITGLIGVVVSRNMLRIVMSLIVMSISIVMNFLAFGCYCSDTLRYANIMSILVVAMTVLQISGAFALFLKVYHTNEYLDVKKIKDKEN